MNKILITILIFSLGYQPFSLAKLSSIQKNKGQVSALEEFATSSYIEVLPVLRMRMGSEGQDKISKLNECYKELKNNGNQDPKVQEVYELFAKKYPKIATADLISVCISLVTPLAAIGGTVGFNYWMYKSYRNIRDFENEEYERMKDFRDRDCKKNASVIMEKIKTNTAAKVSAGRATQ